MSDVETELLALGQLQRPTLALVSELLIAEHPLPVRFIYRTVQANLKDTGWRLFSGYETEHQAALQHLKPYPLEALAKQDPQLLELLQSKPGTVWERLPEQPWQQVHDFEIPTEGDEILNHTEIKGMDDLSD